MTVYGMEGITGGRPKVRAVRLGSVVLAPVGQGATLMEFKESNPRGATPGVAGTTLGGAPGACSPGRGETAKPGGFGV